MESEMDSSPCDTIGTGSQSGLKHITASQNPHNTQNSATWAPCGPIDAARTLPFTFNGIWGMGTEGTIFARASSWEEK